MHSSPSAVPSRLLRQNHATAARLLAGLEGDLHERPIADDLGVRASFSVRLHHFRNRLAYREIRQNGNPTLWACVSWSFKPSWSVLPSRLRRLNCDSTTTATLRASSTLSAVTEHLFDRGDVQLLTPNFIAGKFLRRNADACVQIEQLTTRGTFPRSRRPSMIRGLPTWQFLPSPHWWEADFPPLARASSR
jgi:hypothetical protein